MPYFIISTKKNSQYPNSVEHIEGYGVYSGFVNGKYQYDPYTKGEFFENHFRKDNTYYSWNVDAGASDDPSATSKLYVRELTPGHPFLQSVGDGIKRDNLLNLPDMKGR